MEGGIWGERGMEMMSEKQKAEFELIEGRDKQ